VPDRFSTTTRIRALGVQAQARVYRAAGRKAAGPRRNKLTGRAALLVLVLCALVVALAYPTRQYVAQRAQIADQRKQAEEAQKRVNQLRELKARWQDPEYVKAQAREHLHYLMPGETGYTLVAPSASGSASPPARRASLRGAAGKPWYGNLWSGVDHADDAARR